jgi:hypothetical protein
MLLSNFRPGVSMNVIMQYVIFIGSGGCVCVFHEIYPKFLTHHKEVMLLNNIAWPDVTLLGIQNKKLRTLSP